jgi:hypothetical protein
MSTAKNVLFSSLHVKYAESKSIDVTRAAKLNRSFIRANFDALAKAWPELRESQKSNKDGNRYPSTCPANVAKAIVTRNLNVITTERVSKQQPPREAIVND